MGRPSESPSKIDNVAFLSSFTFWKVQRFAALPMSAIQDILSPDKPIDCSPADSFDIKRPGSSVSITSNMTESDALMHQKNLRTNRIENPRGLAAAFSIAVTVKDAASSSWVARNGEESIFRTLQRILPQVDIVILLQYLIHFCRMIFEYRSYSMRTVDIDFG